MHMYIYIYIVCCDNNENNNSLQQLRRRHAGQLQRELRLHVALQGLKKK